MCEKPRPSCYLRSFSSSDPSVSTHMYLGPVPPSSLPVQLLAVAPTGKWQFGKGQVQHTSLGTALNTLLHDEHQVMNVPILSPKNSHGDITFRTLHLPILHIRHGEAIIWTSQ